MDAYFKARLDHTLDHTQTSTRLIYLVNGAVLAFLYFLLDKEIEPDFKQHAMAAFLILLGAINAVHVWIIWIQGRWYRCIDKAWAKAINTQSPQRTGWPPGSTHGAYAVIHILLAVFLILGAAFLFFANNIFVEPPN